MVGDLSRATFSNIEEQGLDFVRYTLSPWLQIWQQAKPDETLRQKDPVSAQTLESLNSLETPTV
jgi:phage portal protein BeeE